MSIQEITSNLQRAAELLIEETQPLANSAHEQVEGLPGVVDNQRQIQEEAVRRAEAIQSQINQLRTNINSLNELLGEGVQGGEKITTAMEGAGQSLEKAKPTLESADAVLGLTNIDRGKFIPPLERKREEAAFGARTLALMGEAHTIDFTGVKDAGEGLASEVAGLSERAAELVGRIGRLGVPEGCLIEFDYWNPSREVRAVSDFRDAVPDTITAIQEITVIYDSKGAADFGPA